MAEDLYETDFYTWTRRQADHLREGRFDLADLASIVEEIDSLGTSQAAALHSAYRLIAMHLLKLLVQARRATRSCRTMIVRERINADNIIRENPGLKPRRQELFTQAYGAVRKEAAAETGLSRTRFPETPPFTVDEDYWPTPVP